MTPKSLNSERGMMTTVSGLDRIKRSSDKKDELILPEIIDQGMKRRQNNTQALSVGDKGRRVGAGFKRDLPEFTKDLSKDFTGVNNSSLVNQVAVTGGISIKPQSI